MTIDSSSDEVAGTGLSAVDAFDPARRANPYPAYRSLREMGRCLPFSVGAGEIFMITHYRDCVAVLQGAAWGFSIAGPNPFRPGVDRNEGLRSMLRADPPDHTRLRSLVSKAFAGRTTAHLRPTVSALVDSLLDAAAGKEEVDLVGEFARPVPLRTICALLGVPPEDEAVFGTWATALTRGLDPDNILTPAERTRRAEATRGFADYFTELIAKRRASPADDLLSRLVTVRDQGDVLTETEMLETCVLLLVAGYETTVNLVANTVLALARDPGQYALLRSNPELVPSALDETLRHDPPVHWVGRLAREDTELAGRAFAAGDGVVLLLASANRDPDVFADPDRYDVTRYTGTAPPSRHLGFGHGIHYCLGAALARLEANVMVSALVRRFHSVRLTVEELSYRPHLAVRGVESLPVSLVI